MENHLLNLRLTLHQGKRRIYRTQDGITFLGWRLFPTHRRLVRGNVVRFERRLRAMQRARPDASLGTKWRNASPPGTRTPPTAIPGACVSASLKEHGFTARKPGKPPVP